MRFRSILLWTALALTLAPGARAENAVSEKTMLDQAKQGANLPPPTLSPNAADITRSLQVELKRVGCFEGAINGVWDGTIKGALAEFARRAKLDVPTDVPTSTAVETVKSKLNRICPLDCGAGRIERNGACVATGVLDNRPARPPTVVETKRPPRAAPEKERSDSGMCWRNDGRTTALVPCNEAPTGRRAY